VQVARQEEEEEEEEEEEVVEEEEEDRQSDILSNLGRSQFDTMDIDNEEEEEVLVSRTRSGFIRR
jgi:hypothetical protein